MDMLQLSGWISEGCWVAPSTILEVTVNGRTESDMGFWRGLDSLRDQLEGL